MMIQQVAFGGAPQTNENYKLTRLGRDDGVLGFCSALFRHAILLCYKITIRMLARGGTV